MADVPLIRIFSDVHYGDRGSRVRSLDQLRPLVIGPEALVLNGDLLDTRPGPDPDRTRADRTAAREFFARVGTPTTFVTGNHDPDLSAVHAVDLAGGRVLATHGDILFADLVPWGRDATVIHRRIRSELASVPPEGAALLEHRLAVLRRVAAAIPQRHQSERNLARYVLGFASDTLWPPHRLLRVLRAWRELPERAAALARDHRPRARFVVVGHTHRPGVWTTRSGTVVINTGSFGPLFGGLVAEVVPGALRVRRIVPRGGEFHAGAKVAEFPLP